MRTTGKKLRRWSRKDKAREVSTLGQPRAIRIRVQWVQLNLNQVIHQTPRSSSRRSQRKITRSKSSMELSPSFRQSFRKRWMSFKESKVRKRNSKIFTLSTKMKWYAFRMLSKKPMSTLSPNQLRSSQKPKDPRTRNKFKSNKMSSLLSLPKWRSFHE